MKRGRGERGMNCCLAADFICAAKQKQIKKIDVT